MQALSEFKPPQPNRVVLWLCELLFPLYVIFVERLHFRFLESPGSPVKFLKDKSAVVVINHGDRQDPLVVVALAKHMREAFYCIVAREVFDWNGGILGWLFQKLGCYSVNRGVADFKSIHTTHDILTHAHRKLVVFPESEITGDEQSIHELNRSFIHMLLESQDDIAQDESKHSIWVLPVGVTYRLESTLDKSVSNTLSKIERDLGISQNARREIETRVACALEAVLQRLSEVHNCPLLAEQPQQERVHLLARHLCEQIKNYVRVDSKNHQSDEQLLYLLRNQVTNKLAARKCSSKYHQKVSHDLEQIYRKFLRDLDRVERLLILERILSYQPSPVQICRTLDFLEAETNGVMTKKGRQCASIFLGRPIEVLPYLLSYKSCKDSAIDLLSASIRHELQTALNSSTQGPTLKISGQILSSPLKTTPILGANHD